MKIKLTSVPVDDQAKALGFTPGIEDTCGNLIALHEA